MTIATLYTFKTCGSKGLEQAAQGGKRCAKRLRALGRSFVMWPSACTVLKFMPFELLIRHIETVKTPCPSG